MRRFTMACVLSAASVTAALAGTMTGWISDSSCGVSNASAKKESRECAERCIKNGSDAVFVSDADSKVYKIAGKAKVTDHIMHKVKVTGDVKGDTITVTDIKKAD